MIIADVTNFTGTYSNLNGNNQQLNVSRIKLAHGAITVGQQSYMDVRNLGALRIIQIFSTIYSNVITNDSNNLCIKNQYYALEKTEKDYISNLLGNAVAKVCSELLIGCQWIVHLDKVANVVLKRTGQPLPGKINLYNSNKIARRPDFIGYDNNRMPHVFESKGSCHSFKPSVLQHAINQVSQIIDINGVYPATRVACFADCSTAGVKAHIVDPENEGDGISLSFEIHDLIKTYYQAFLDPMWNESFDFSFGGIKYNIIPISYPHIYYGIQHEHLKLIREGKFSEHFFDIPKPDIDDYELLEREISISSDGSILINKPQKTNRFTSKSIN